MADKPELSAFFCLLLLLLFVVMGVIDEIPDPDKWPEIPEAIFSTIVPILADVIVMARGLSGKSVRGAYRAGCFLLAAACLSIAIAGLTSNSSTVSLIIVALLSAIGASCFGYQVVKKLDPLDASKFVAPKGWGPFLFTLGIGIGVAPLLLHLPDAVAGVPKGALIRSGIFLVASVVCFHFRKRFLVQKWNRESQ